MKLNHRVSIASTPAISDELSALGIEVASKGFVVFDIDEAHPQWDCVAAWIAERRAGDIVTTSFTKGELDSASWVELVADWYCGYPQPDEDGFGYREATYDLSDWCEQCGIGLRQRRPFQMRGTPKWGSRNITQLHWVGDEFFVKPGFWRAHLEPLGVGARPVHDVDGRELHEVLQLTLDPEGRVGDQALPREHCSACGREKSVWSLRGMFPALREVPSSNISTTDEYFGSGAAAARAVIVSAALGRKLQRHAHGVFLRPVMEAPSGADGLLSRRVSFPTTIQPRSGRTPSAPSATRPTARNTPTSGWCGGMPRTSGVVVGSTTPPGEPTSYATTPTPPSRPATSRRFRSRTARAGASQCRWHKHVSRPRRGRLAAGHREIREVRRCTWTMQSPSCGPTPMTPGTP